MCLLDPALLPLEGFNYIPAESKASGLDLYRRHPRGQNLNCKCIQLYCISIITYTVYSIDRLNVMKRVPGQLTVVSKCIVINFVFMGKGI